MVKNKKYILLNQYYNIDFKGHKIEHNITKLLWPHIYTYKHNLLDMFIAA